MSLKTIVLRAGFAAFLGLAAGPVTGSDYEPTPGDDALSDEGVLELLPGVDIHDVLARYPGFTLLDSIPSRNTYLVSYLNEMTEDEFEDLFLGDPDIDHTELNFNAGDPGPGTQSTFLNSSPDAYQDQPVWTNLGVGSAHTVATGRGATIAIVDTGIDIANPLFLDKIHPDSIGYIDGPGDIRDIGNGVNDDGEGEIDEMVGHGTWVAGIATMIAPDAQLMIIRAMDDEGFLDQFTLAKAVYHAIDHGADVINLSLSSVAQVRVVERAVDDASDLGIIVVAAAGNQGYTTPEFPAGNNKAIGIASVHFDGRLTGFTNFGDDDYFAAPGIDIVGPIPGGFGESSGTSASVPMVAGAAALGIQLGTVRRADDFEDMLEDTSIELEDLNPGYDDNDVPEGMLDLAAAAAWPGPCFADLHDDGDGDEVLDLRDINEFIVLFTQQDEDVDYVDPRGAWDLADLQFFLQEFLAGCPGD